MHSKFFKCVSVFLFISLLISGITACGSDADISESSMVGETEETIPPTPLNEGISGSVTYADSYHTTKIASILPELRFDNKYIDDVDVFGSSYVYTYYSGESSIISYKNIESGAGLDFSIIENPESTSKLSLINDSIYSTQIKEGKLYVSKCTFEDGSLGNNYYYVLDVMPNGKYSEIFTEDGTYYILTSGDENGNGQEIREYVFDDFKYGEEIEARRSRTGSIVDYEGLVLLNNNVYGVRRNGNSVEYVCVNDLLNGDGPATTLTYDELPTLYSDSQSEFVNLLGTPIYISAETIEELNIRKPVGFTTMYSPIGYDVNSDGSIYMYAYNGLYEVVEGEAEVPCLNEVYNGHYEVLCNPNGVYETADGVYATFINTEPYIIETADLDIMFENAVSISEDEINGKTIRTIELEDTTIYAIMIDSVRWKLFYSADAYLEGLSGGDYRIVVDTFTVRLSDNVTYSMNVNSEEEEELIALYRTFVNTDAYITIRDNEVTEIEFYYND